MASSEGRRQSCLLSLTLLLSVFSSVIVSALNDNIISTPNIYQSQKNRMISAKEAQDDGDIDAMITENIGDDEQTGNDVTYDASSVSLPALGKESMGDDKEDGSDESESRENIMSGILVPLQNQLNKRRAFSSDLGKRGNNRAFSADLGKRGRSFSADLGKRGGGSRSFSSDLGKRGSSARSFSSDLGKRSARTFSADLGKRASRTFSADLGKRGAGRVFSSDLGKRARSFSADLGKRSVRVFSSDLGKRTLDHSDDVIRVADAELFGATGDKSNRGRSSDNDVLEVGKHILSLPKNQQ